MAMSSGCLRTDERDPGRHRRSGRQRTVAATAPTKENQTYCSKLVGSSQATPTETAKAAPPKRWRHDEHGHEDGHAVACAARADSHDLIRVHGARENNLKDVSVKV